jgi:hypothetical protein
MADVFASVQNPKTTEVALWEANGTARTPTRCSGLDRGAEPLRHVDARRQAVCLRGLGQSVDAPGAALPRARSSGPVQLTFGPINFSGVMPSRDGSVSLRWATSARAGWPATMR